jgi:hypothetical protein
VLKQQRRKAPDKQSNLARNIAVTEAIVSFIQPQHWFFQPAEITREVWDCTKKS